MKWRVEIARDARKELARLPAAMQSRLARVMLALEDNPLPNGSKKLKNRDGWRIRVRDYRILYFVDADTRIVTVGVIGHRRDVYRR